MTSNQINNRAQGEEARHNRETESNTRRGQNISAVSQGASSAGGIISNIAGGLVRGLLQRKNDPSWYNLNPQLVRDVASLSYHTPLGTASNLPGRTSVADLDREAIPGIMAIRYIPTIGTSSSAEASAANIAAKNIYSYVRYANSGARNYEANDLMMYLLAMDSAYTFYAYLCGIYSAAKNANGANWYQPVTMVTALGADYKSVSRNLANMRAYINQFAQRLSAFYVPSQMPIYSRHMWLGLNLFKETDTARSKLFMFLPELIYTYNSVDGILNPYNFRLTGNPTLDQLMEVGDIIVGALVSSEDVGIMSGDILKAYGYTGLVQLPSIDENFHIEPVYSQEVLSQINGATLVGDPVLYSRLAISQDQQGHIFMGQYKNSTKGRNAKAPAEYLYPIFTFVTANGAVKEGDQPIIGAFPNIRDTLLNMYKDDVTPDDNMVATRLSVSMEYDISQFYGPLTDNPIVAATVKSYGTEICTSATIFLYDATGATQQLKFKTNNSFIEYNAEVLYLLSALNKFNCAPTAYFDLYTSYSSTEALKFARGLCSTEIVNYVTVMERELTNMHSVAIQSEFGIPLIGSSPKNTNASLPTSGGSRNTKRSNTRRNSNNKSKRGGIKPSRDGEREA